MSFDKNYRRKLSGEDLKRYELKMQMCGGLDPYNMDPGKDFVVVPDVCREDLANYLVLSSDFCTLKQLKSYKALDAHNFLTSGHINSVVTKETGHQKVIAFGKVINSQRINETPVLCRILLENDGEVRTAHCTCMAGVGAACSHVGAILFFLELAAGKIRDTTCTSTSTAWLPPAVRTTAMREIKDCDLRSARKKWKTMSSSEAQDAPKMRRSQPIIVQPPSDEHMRSVLAEIQKKALQCPILCVVEVLPPVNESPSSRMLLPPPIAVFDKNGASMGFEELIKHCENVFQLISITNDQAVSLEMSTRGQQNNPLWKKHRAGRITASLMKAVCRGHRLAQRMHQENPHFIEELRNTLSTAERNMSPPDDQQGTPPPQDKKQ